MTLKASQLRGLANKLQRALEQKDFESIAKWNQVLLQVLPNIDQHDENYRATVLKVKHVHRRCIELVDLEQSVLKQQIEHNASLKTRDKAYAQTQVRARES
ncbi:hypothetical protein [Vibrio sp. 10N]|uniref:hypothetical protein n=1 Tax=Vibrio sp. 10N TaxID=3058938 RepID=UPI0028132C3E|nr:hypothetical protein VB10N_08080 [Vibrio sp. 10N]